MSILAIFSTGTKFIGRLLTLGFYKPKNGDIAKQENNSMSYVIQAKIGNEYWKNLELGASTLDDAMKSYDRIRIDYSSVPTRFMLLIRDDGIGRLQRFHLSYRCEWKHEGYENHFVFISKGYSLGERYEDDSWNNEILIWFDKEPEYNINVFKIRNSLIIQNDDFLSKVKKHQTLFAKIHLRKDLEYIAEFDISGF